MFMYKARYELCVSWYLSDKEFIYFLRPITVNTRLSVANADNPNFSTTLFAWTIVIQGIGTQFHTQLLSCRVHFYAWKGFYSTRTILCFPRLLSPNLHARWSIDLLSRNSEPWLNKKQNVKHNPMYSTIFPITELVWYSLSR